MRTLPTVERARGRLDETFAVLALGAITLGLAMLAAWCFGAGDALRR